MYLPFSNWCGTANGHCPLEQQTNTVRLLFQINRCMVNTIWFRFDLMRFRKHFSVCTELNFFNNHRYSYPRGGKGALGIIWKQLNTPLKPLEHHSRQYGTQVFKESPHYVERRKSLIRRPMMKIVDLEKKISLRVQWAAKFLGDAISLADCWGKKHFCFFQIKPPRALMVFCFFFQQQSAFWF